MGSIARVSYGPNGLFLDELKFFLYFLLMYSYTEEGSTINEGG